MTSKYSRSRETPAAVGISTTASIKYLSNPVCILNYAESVDVRPQPLVQFSFLFVVLFVANTRTWL